MQLPVLLAGQESATRLQKSMATHKEIRASCLPAMHPQNWGSRLLLSQYGLSWRSSLLEADLLLKTLGKTPFCIITKTGLNCLCLVVE